MSRYTIHTLIKVTGIVGMGALLFAGANLAIPKPKPVAAKPVVVTPAPTPPPEPTMLQRINAERAKAGKTAVTEDPKLDLAAKQKVADMVKFNAATHQMPDGSLVFAHLRAQYPGYKAAGENLAECQTSDAQTVAMWVASPAHFAVMTAPADGFGYAEQKNPKDGCTWTASYFIKY
jgi:uncharacterized protein YkwD